MTNSENINELAAALAVAQSEIHGAKKDAENPHFRSKYADLASVWDACRTALTKNGLSVVQSPRARLEGAGWAVEVETTLLHKSGQFMSDTLTVPMGKADAQAVGSAVTYARRYALAAFVGIAPEDDDGNAATADAPTQTHHERPVYRDTKPQANGGVLTVTSVTPKPTSNPKVTRFEVVFSDGVKTATINHKLANVATALRDAKCVVTRETEQTKFGTDLVSLVRVDTGEVSEDGPELTDDEIPF